MTSGSGFGDYQLPGDAFLVHHDAGLLRNQNSFDSIDLHPDEEDHQIHHSKWPDDKTLPIFRGLQDILNSPSLKEGDGKLTTFKKRWIILRAATKLMRLASA